MDILQICSSLITMEDNASIIPGGSDESSDPEIRLAHFSVKEYLVSETIRYGSSSEFSIQEVESNACLAVDCLVYLLQFDEPITPKPKTIEGIPQVDFFEEFPLARYAATFWTGHARVAEAVSKILPLLSLELFLGKREVFINWLRLRHYEEDMPDSVGTPLYYASQAGLNESVELLLDRGADFDDPGKDLTTPLVPLQAASSFGYLKIVEMLIKKVANVKGGIYGSPLIVASYRGYEMVVRTLLDHGADVNLGGGRFGNVIRTAIEGGNEAVVQILMDHGADFNQQDTEGRAVAHFASARGMTGLLERLVKLGSDLSITDKQGRGCLHHAAAAGSTKSTSWLLSQGFDPNLSDRDAWTPLHWGAKHRRHQGVKHGNPYIITLLENAGAKSSTENIMGWTPQTVGIFHGNDVPWGSCRKFPHDSLAPKPYLEIDATEKITGITTGTKHPGTSCDGCHMVNESLSMSKNLLSDMSR